MKEETSKAKTLLNNHELSLVVIKNNEVYTSDKKGVLPVFELLEDARNLLSGAVAADKVIGGAAAFLFVKGGISELYSEVISENAVRILQNAEIPFSYGTLVPYIINRKGDDLCPMEKLCLNLKDFEEAYEKIKGFILKMI